MLEDWTIYSWYCPNCKTQVAGLKNKKNQIRVICTKCSAEMVRTVVGRRHDVIDIYAPIYSEEDIAAAIDTIKKEFKSNWNGCTLTEIYYAGDDSSKDHQDWADRNNADEVIVLLSSFDVDSSGGDGSLNPNSTYNDWKWILVRTNGGQWQHVDHGY